MCGRALIVPREVVDQIVQDIIRKRIANYLPDWPAVRHSFRPGDEVTVILSDAAEPESAFFKTQTLRWGYEASWSKSLLFNTRYETALDVSKPNMWHDSLLNRRCIVPSLGFYETHRSETFVNPKTGKSNKQQYLFTLPDTPLIFLAGIYEQDRFSLMTTKPNAYVEPIHNRMPVVLREEELFTWLSGDFAKLFDRSELMLNVEKEQHPGSATQEQLSFL